MKFVFDAIFYAFCIQLCSILLNFGSMFAPMLVSFWLHFGFNCFPGGVPGTGSRNVHEIC